MGRLCEDKAKVSSVTRDHVLVTKRTDGPRPPVVGRRRADHRATSYLVGKDCEGGDVVADTVDGFSCMCMGRCWADCCECI